MEDRIAKILKERYLLEGEAGWRDIVDRVSGIYPPVKPLLEEMRFLPSTPTLSNYDPENRTTGGLSSCFPLSLGDSMESIGDAVRDCMVITKYSGGVGYVFSNLRSTKETVKGCNNARAGGGLSFERLFNQVLEEIQQGGRRRGAGMAAYDIDYPDILEVIDAKMDVNDSRYSKFNHSIRVPDSFYRTLEATPDAVHMVRFKNGELAPLKDGKGENVSVSALWDRILRSAWMCAEPGILNIDRMVERNPVTDDPTRIANNPCLHGDSEISTSSGSVKIKDLAGTKDMPMLSCLNERTGMLEWEIPVRVWKTRENAEIVEVELADWRKLRLTPDHRVLTTSRGWMEAERLEENENVAAEYGRVGIVKSVKRVDERADVYDIEMPANHNFFANGICVHNCAEFCHVVDSSCNLGSFNIVKYLKKDAEGRRVFDWESFGEDIVTATCFMDAVIDKNKFPTETIARTTRDVRPIGIGVMGLAHALILMGIPYSSEEACSFAEELLLFLEFSVKIRSARNAKVKGAYPAFDPARYLKANEKLLALASKRERTRKLKDEFMALFADHGVRNSVATSNAPNGTISFIADVSGGIEPVFALQYFRDVETGVDRSGKSVKRRESMLDPVLEQWLEERGKDKGKALEHVQRNAGSLQKCPELSREEQELWKTASELTVKEHLAMLAACSGAISTNCSKTINLPNSISKEEMGDVFMDAWKLGIIGVTVYRDGCREGVLTTSGTKSARQEQKERPRELPAEMYHFQLMSKMTDEKGEILKVVRPYYVAVSVLNGMPYEIFSSMSNHTEPGRESEIYIPKHLTTGKIVRAKAGTYHYTEDGTGETVQITGKHTLPEANLINRLVSLGFRNGIPLEEIVEQLSKNNAITDYGQAIVRYIKKFLKEGAKTGNLCESCLKEGTSTNMLRAEGCLKCPTCGWSKCG